MKPTARKLALALALLSALLAATPPVPARAQQRPLPAFAVETLDGAEEPGDQLSARRQWLLIYVQPNCAPCAEVFKALRRNGEQPDLTEKVVVVVGGATADEAKKLAGRAPWLPPAAWRADPSRRAAAALSVKGSPTVYGVRLGKIEWDLKGATADPRVLKSILETWIEE